MTCNQCRYWINEGRALESDEVDRGKCEFDPRRPNVYADETCGDFECVS